MRFQEGSKEIIELLRLSEPAESAGTLLYALNRLKVKIPLMILCNLILYGSFEARQEALGFIECGEFDIDLAEIRETKRKLEAVEKSVNEEKRYAVRHALLYLNSLVWRQSPQACGAFSALRSSSSCPKTYLRVDQFNGGGSLSLFR